MPIEKAQLYADLYTDYVRGRADTLVPVRETHLVSVGDMLLVADGPAPRKTVWERLRFWVYG